MMILLQTYLLYFFLKVGIIPLIEYRNIPLGSYPPKLFRRKHLQIFINGGYSECTVITYLSLPGVPFLGRNLDNSRRSSRTVLRSLRSVFQDCNTFDIGRINRRKHI